MQKQDKREKYDVWADGSAFNHGRYMGAGWVIFHGTQKIKSKYKAITTPIRGTSLLAEINAAELALADIPADAVVTLHTDCEEVIKFLKDPHVSVTRKGKAKHRESTIEAFRRLFNAAAKLKEVSVLKTNDKIDLTHKLAHGLAQTGAVEAKKMSQKAKYKHS
jgi:ribonuclease HI